MSETLKFPSGEFTHTELAQLNGKTNQQVWTRYQQAIKDGVIVSAGTRASAGKGKPSKLWKLATGQPVPVVAVVADVPKPVAPVIAATIPTEAVVVPAAQPAPVVEAPKLPEVTPAVAPTPAPESSVEAVTVEVVRVEPAPEAEIKPPTVNDVVKDARTLTEKCPICGNPSKKTTR